MQQIAQSKKVAILRGIKDDFHDYDWDVIHYVRRFASSIQIPTYRNSLYGNYMDDPYWRFHALRYVLAYRGYSLQYHYSRWMMIQNLEADRHYVMDEIKELMYSVPDRHRNIRRRI
jgi:hypothetical protein